MINTLKEVINYLEDLEKNETNTPIRLRTVLKSIDSDNILPYVKSFIMNIFNSLYKSNNIHGERICSEFIKNHFWKFNSLLMNENVSYTELLSVTKKYILIFLKEKLEGYNRNENNSNEKVSTEYRVYFKAIANKRNKQEDRFFCVSDIVGYSSNHICQNKKTCTLNKKSNIGNISLLGLFDGHNGPEAAEHCHHLAPHLLSHHIQESLCSKGRYNLIEALGETFYLLNFKLNGCRNKYHWKAGTTSTMCLIDHRTVYTSWVGDSSAWLIYNDNTQVPLTNMLHRPSQNSEIIDVWNNGGIVTKSGKEYDRVNGILAVTRALGDDRKIVGVSALPSISECRLNGKELCLILASDGLWDSRNCSGENIGDVCREYFSDDKNKHDSGESLCQILVDRAVQGGASDNISLMILMFDEHKRTITSSESFDYSYQDSRAIQWPKDRRMSSFSEDLHQLRSCPDKLNNYLQIHFSHNAKMRTVVNDAHSKAHSKRETHRSRSLSQGVHKRFSSPIRSITRDSLETNSVNQNYNSDFDLL